MDFTGINPATVMQASVRARVEHPERYRVTAPKRQKSPVQQVVHHHVEERDGTCAPLGGRLQHHLEG